MTEHQQNNVVNRLQQRLVEARGMGFTVRMELLADEQATWCEIAGVPTLFVDLSQTAGEQLRQVEETLDAYAAASDAADPVAADRDIVENRIASPFDPVAGKHAA